MAEGTCGGRRGGLRPISPSCRWTEGEPFLSNRRRTGLSDREKGRQYATGQFQDQLTWELLRRLGNAPTSAS